jgi:hypothetical protein
MAPVSNLFQDWLAIGNLKARYCRLLDTKQWDAFAELLTEDFELDVREASGGRVPLLRGRDAAVAMTRGSIERAQTAHQVHSPEIEIEGDQARGIWAMQDRVIWGAERPGLTGYGHYHETYVRLNGAWKIRSSRLSRLIVEMAPDRASSETG